MFAKDDLVFSDIDDCHRILNNLVDDFSSKLDAVHSALIFPGKTKLCAEFSDEICDSIEDIINSCPDDFRCAYSFTELIANHTEVKLGYNIYKDYVFEKRDANWYLYYMASNYCLRMQDAQNAVKLRQRALNVCPPNINECNLVAAVKCLAADVVKQDAEHPSTKKISLYKEFCCETCHESLSLIQIDQPIVMANEWWVISKTGEVYTDLNCQKKNRYNSFYLNPDCELDYCNVIVPSPVYKHCKDAVIIGGSANYYEWTINSLPLLLSVMTEPQAKNLPIVINADVSTAQKDILKHYKLSRNKTIKLAYPSAHQFEKCMMPIMSFESRITCLRSCALGLLKKKRSVKVPEIEKIYVSRKNAAHRKVHNEQKLIDVLQEQGFFIMEVEKYSIFEQMAMFAKAEIVVGAHGSGLTNIVYAKTDCKVVEISAACWGKPDFYLDIAKQIGQEHYMVSTSCIEDAPSMPLDWDCVITEDCIENIMNVVS